MNDSVVRPEAADEGITAVLAATLLFVGWRALSGGVPLSAAGIAVAGVAILGARLTTACHAAGTLSESARYVDDYRAFVEPLPQVRHSESHYPAPSSFAEMSANDTSLSRRLPSCQIWVRWKFRWERLGVGPRWPW
jgi:hypothetical protein